MRRHNVLFLKSGRGLIRIVVPITMLCNSKIILRRKKKCLKIERRIIIARNAGIRNRNTAYSQSHQRMPMNDLAKYSRFYAVPPVPPPSPSLYHHHHVVVVVLCSVLGRILNELHSPTWAWYNQRIEISGVCVWWWPKIFYVD